MQTGRGRRFDSEVEMFEKIISFEELDKMLEILEARRSVLLPLLVDSADDDGKALSSLVDCANEISGMRVRFEGRLSASVEDRRKDCISHFSL